ncbi:hypothetical protein GKZ28_06705 [Clostridium chromiireducens]|uniref:Cysteine-rich CPCC domain-containing protein n=1 Tax=Clostridium chromiireducens TaxID=225345 RepID=A0A964W1L7_9CLOT|nr:CPCC family cysteine-rich protein [Clostridium chromiireducens]MVX63384.1 hypothetical protein [Clostridium chromiireducens]
MKNTLKKNDRLKYKCPCCGCFTFDEEPDGNYDISPVCFWKDDPIQLFELKRVNLKDINYFKLNE